MIRMCVKSFKKHDEGKVLIELMIKEVNEYLKLITVKISLILFILTDLLFMRV